eukprot:CAMPEP_0169262306 /NCGR_PEP_ID=MMETSP1016-20121227/43635_1 /TAXON_ID=342587 /ORGANISM="Karlodinium micrum, Strain CCMP2283" /LENGTH=157 /DNA_ID=CAMNT_0009344819 /DNA_START=411 /DNA_END=880 /DNA_ORIENTATION=-
MEGRPFEALEAAARQVLVEEAGALPQDLAPNQAHLTSCCPPPSQRLREQDFVSFPRGLHLDFCHHLCPYGHEHTDPDRSLDGPDHLSHRGNRALAPYRDCPFLDLGRYHALDHDHLSDHDRHVLYPGYRHDYGVNLDRHVVDRGLGCDFGCDRPCLV